ncbi:adenosylmethionine-8-amino-7-oxononanoate aminotransferase [Alkalihalobacillus xiaoxiensis]|uniref:Adenosylmethionine-8-amino-7-oxononanoate aminotransferase n=1 Tax=Shouchella xiaoxiensis TaxID=766895 RepID=A0ABS2T090_9BACI|nr:aminotransferase [Shouchella xiaoxiensis]MBM7841202.1 adenosylmethionine-8-amino-7-oxononanoate aminotransferase [Shouchella xiaoxiensis]
MEAEIKKSYGEKDQEHLWHALKPYQAQAAPLIAESGEGSWFTDTEGNRYFDGVSGLWCLNLGHGQTEIIEAATEQMKALAYFPLSFGHKPAIDLAEKLNELLGGGYRSFFANGGSDANETAFKIARQHHKQSGNPEKTKIISRYRAYHGNSLGALAATAQANRKMKYEVNVPGFIHIPPPYAYRSAFGSYDDDDLRAAEYLEQTILWEGPESVAAFIMEPVISGGGVIHPQSDLYYKKVRDICNRYNVLLILDEVVSGFGRTGKMFGYMHGESLYPDIITFAKGLTAGYLPLGATCVKESIYQSFKDTGTTNHFRHVSTYGGHPASCAVALKTIELIERHDIVKQVATLEADVLSQLRQLTSHALVGEVRGVGFLYGIELVSDKASKKPLEDEQIKTIVAACQKKGLIIGKNGDTVPSGGNVLIIAPPLTSTREDLTFLVETIQEVFAEIE